MLLAAAFTIASLVVHDARACEDTTCTLPSREAIDAVEMRTDIAYRVVGTDTLRLDLARPGGSGATHPLVVVVHGGGWRGGDKSSRLAPSVRRLAAAGYVVASVEYRLTTSAETRFPAALEDVWCAVTHLAARAAEYRLDPARVALLGESAGSQLAAMVAYAPQVAARGCGGAELASGIRAFVGMYGIYDLIAADSQPRLAPVLEHYLGESPRRDEALGRRASPVSHAGQRAVPALLVHGRADRSVPLAQSHLMNEAVSRGGAETRVVEVDGMDHGFPFLSDAPELLEPSCALLEFLAHVMADRADEQGEPIRILAHDYAFRLPARMPAGLVHLRLVNNGTEPHYMAIMRTDATHGLREFADWRASRSPRPAWLTPVGGHGTIAAGDSVGLALHLVPGRYVVFCGYPSPDGSAHVDKGMLGEFVVEDAGAARAADPIAAATVRLDDFTISPPRDVLAGPRTIRFVNGSSQTHQALVVALTPGVTAEQELAWFRNGARGARLGVPAGGVLQLPAGQSAFVTLTLKPGRYLIVCAVSDAARRQHHEFGMSTVFEVR